MRLLFAVGLIVLGSTIAIAEPNSGSYFCTVDAAGGLKYDATVRRWVGSAFLPEKGFVLKMEHLSSRKDEQFNEMVEVYKVSVTEQGERNVEDCMNAVGKGDIELYSNGYLNCHTFYRALRFNPRNLRFLRSYNAGYLDGKDENSDTPAITAGTCTRIP